jgi:peptidoglycan/LPS O-acetylase OafA/YrhL
LNGYTKKYFPNLDATRFLAFVTVFLEHMVITNNAAIRDSTLYNFYTEHFKLGVIGWDFYTVLSGFLITWIILEEYKLTSAFSLLYFWIKRCLRIWPLYFLMILVAAVMVSASRYAGNSVHDIPPLGWLLTFTLNFYIVQHGQAFLFFLVFFWSISIEEQLYVLWGIVSKWAKKLLPWVALLLIIASIIFRIYALHDPVNLYFNSLGWCGNFAIGALLAYFCMRNGKVFERFTNMPKWVIAMVYALFIVNVVFYKQIYASDMMTVVERLSASCFFSFMIFEQSFCKNHLFEWDKWNRMSYLGKISYGLFCYHGLMILLFERLITHFGWLNSSISVFLINPLLIFAITIGVSIISYEYIERPIMRLRHRIKPA